VCDLSITLLVGFLFVSFRLPHFFTRSFYALVGFLMFLSFSPSLFPFFFICCFVVALAVAAVAFAEGVCFLLLCAVSR
jgi:hypothetical protein